MPKQPAFSGLRNAKKEKRTQRQLFQVAMDTAAPWDRLPDPITPHCPKAGPKGGGAPVLLLEMMLRIRFLQNWYALSDPMAEETLYVSGAMRRFAGIGPGEDRIRPFGDAWHHLPGSGRGHHPQLPPPAGVARADRGVLRRGQPSPWRQGDHAARRHDCGRDDHRCAVPGKEQGGARDPDMASAMKGNDRFHGMKARIGVDTHSGVTHSLGTLAARLPPSHRMRCIRPRGRVRRPRQIPGYDARSAQGQPAAPDRRMDRSHHRHGARQARASPPRHQAPVRLHEDPLPGAGLEPRNRLPTPRLTRSERTKP